MAKGFISINKLIKDFKKLESLLGQNKSYLDSIYYCPCHPEKGHKGEIKNLKNLSVEKTKQWNVFSCYKGFKYR